MKENRFIYSAPGSNENSKLTTTRKIFEILNHEDKGNTCKSQLKNNRLFQLTLANLSTGTMVVGDFS